MKFEQFSASQELVKLLDQYKTDYDRPDSDYFSGKKQAEQLSVFASSLSDSIRANTSNRDRMIEMVKHFANQIIQECDSDKYVNEDLLPKKNDVLGKDIKLIEEQLNKDMVGKILLYSRGKCETFIKIESCEVNDASSFRFTFSFKGNMLAILPDDMKSYYDQGSNLMYSIGNQMQIDDSLFVPGVNKHTKETLSLVTESQMKPIIAMQAQRIANGFDILIGSVFGK